MTGDQRLLLTGRREAIAIVDLPEIGSQAADIKLVAAHTKQFSQMLDSLSDIFADGKADEHDRRAIKTYGNRVDELIAVLIRSKHAFEEIIGAK